MNKSCEEGPPLSRPAVGEGNEGRGTGSANKRGNKVPEEQCTPSGGRHFRRNETLGGYVICGNSTGLSDPLLGGMDGKGDLAMPLWMPGGAPSF